MITNPSGMGTNNNIVDFAYDEDSRNLFGIATKYEGGSTSEMNTVLEFQRRI